MGNKTESKTESKIKAEKNYGFIAIIFYIGYIVSNLILFIDDIIHRDLYGYSFMEYILEYFQNSVLYDLYFVIGFISFTLMLMIIKNNKITKHFETQISGLFFINVVFIFIRVCFMLDFLFIVTVVHSGGAIFPEGYSVILAIIRQSLVLTAAVLATLITYNFLKLVKMYLKQGENVTKTQYRKIEGRLKLYVITIAFIAGVTLHFNDITMIKLINYTTIVFASIAYFYTIKWFLYDEHKLTVDDKIVENINLFGTLVNSEKTLTMDEKVEILKGYKELLDNGIITVEEFEEKKHDIL